MKYDYVYSILTLRCVYSDVIVAERSLIIISRQRHHRRLE